MTILALTKQNCHLGSSSMDVEEMDIAFMGRFIPIPSKDPKYVFSFVCDFNIIHIKMRPHSPVFNIQIAHRNEMSLNLWNIDVDCYLVYRDQTKVFAFVRDVDDNSSVLTMEPDLFNTVLEKTGYSSKIYVAYS